MAALPGFRRRFEVTPLPGLVRAEVEDDYHRMSVEIEHDGALAHAVHADMIRVPWTTCPGAVAVVERTFTGVPLAGFVARGEKLANCTHLHDLALLAAAHAGDAEPLAYDISVSDAVDGCNHAELRLNGAVVLAWSHAAWEIVAPEPLTGLRIGELGPWIASLDPRSQEHARLLRWGTILANGRAISFGQRADKQRLPLGQCYTFQPQNAPLARYVAGTVRDFSAAAEGPLGAATRNAA